MPTLRTRRHPLRHATVATAAAAALILAACGNDGDQSSSTGGDGDADAITALQVIVPADPGGGWDQTGRAIDRAAQEADLLSNVTVQNIPGAGGTVGLASLVNETDPNTLMVTGLVMVGAVETNDSANRIEDTTPIARLTEEALTVVVPAQSEYQTLDDLVNDIVENGRAVTITGGSAGGADHILAGLLLGAAGVPAAETNDKLNYVANSGGGEAVTLLLGNNASAGISGVGEFAQYVESGDLRALAVSSAEENDLLPGVPTMIEAGYDVELTNWRGVLAPGNIDGAQRGALVAKVTELHGSDAWQEQLESNGWVDAFLAGDEFDTFLEGNIAEVTETLQTIGLTQ